MVHQLTSVGEAQEFISSQIQSSIESVELNDAIGRILAVDIKADTDLPPYHRVAMDGIATNMNAWNSGKRRWVIEGIQKAGEQGKTLKFVDACLEVMTGAVLPIGCNIVIPYEFVDIKDGRAVLKEEKKNMDMEVMFNIHVQGSDAKRDDVLIKKGKKITAPDIAIMASVGKARIDVLKIPKIAIVSTGDELVDIEVVPASHQIRKSNVYALQAELLAHCPQLQVGLFHFRDDEKQLEAGLYDILNQFDWVVLSGGVSAGKFDFIPEVMLKLGVEKVFHKVAQRPGKPLFFGVKESTAGKKLVFGLPGNPVSSVVNLRRYIIPLLEKRFEGITTKKKQAVLTGPFSWDRPMTYFVPCLLTYHEGILQAEAIKGNGSGDHLSLSRSDGFIEIPASFGTLAPGQKMAFDCYPWGE